MSEGPRLISVRRVSPTSNPDPPHHHRFFGRWTLTAWRGRARGSPRCLLLPPPRAPWAAATSSRNPTTATLCLSTCGDPVSAAGSARCAVRPVVQLVCTGPVVVRGSNPPRQSHPPTNISLDRAGQMRQGPAQVRALPAAGCHLRAPPQGRPLQGGQKRRARGGQGRRGGHADQQARAAAAQATGAVAAPIAQATGPGACFVSCVL